MPDGPFSHGAFFYNEAGYRTHVRLLFGDEKAADEVGYAPNGLAGRADLEESLRRVIKAGDTRSDYAATNDALGATIKALPILLYGDVDAWVESSAHFRLPGW